MTGFMAAGKTRVGGLVARRLHLAFVDLDRQIEEEAAAAIPEIFSGQGEAAFRALESAALARAAELPAVVVSTGGGVVESEANIETMSAAGRVVWLDVAWETLEARLRKSRKQRPLFREPAAARRLYESRLPAYRRCDLRVPVAAEEAAEGVADRIVELLADGESSCAT